MVGVICLGPLAARGFESTYWVWHRSEPLSIAEGKALFAQGVRQVYWHSGELRGEAGAWRETQELAVPRPAWDLPVTVIPVLRLAPDDSPPLDAAAADLVGRALAHLAQLGAAPEVQLDFDCPDRRLAEYAAFLAKIRQTLAPIRLSATALAGWSRLPAFAQLQDSVDALFPMFYDLEPDAPGKLVPLTGAGLPGQIASWKDCRVPWYAGLPNFARLSVFESDGRSRGHIREWTWDDVSFNPALVLAGEPAPGLTVLRSETATILAETPLTPDQTLACRLPDRLALAAAVVHAQNAGARGIAIFRLPGEGPQGGWSLAQMGTILQGRKVGEPHFICRLTANGLELENDSATDLPPRLSGPADARDRGWQLEVEYGKGPTDVFREASAGEFAEVFGHKDPNGAVPRRVPIPMAERLTYWFSDLRAGESRRTGLLQVPAAFIGELRWRIPGSPQNSDWQSFTL